METRSEETYSPELYDELCNIMELSPYSTEQTARLLIGEMAARAKADGMTDAEIAEVLMNKSLITPVEPSGRREMNISPPQRPSLVKTQMSEEDIRSKIELLNTFLLCSELVLSGEMQNYALRILRYMRENGMYRHKLKKHANTLKDISDRLLMRCNWEDRDITIKQGWLVSHEKEIPRQFYEDGGSILNRMSVAFDKEYSLKIKRIRLDNRWIAGEWGGKHIELAADLLTLIALAHTDIELYQEVQRQKYSFTRGRVKFRNIKSLHSEGMENAANAIMEEVFGRFRGVPSEKTEFMRTHLTEFQKDITGQKQFALFESQFTALTMDYIEYMLASVRKRMQKGKNSIPYSVAKMVRIRMGNLSRAKQAMKELLAIPYPKKEMDTWDYSKRVATSKGEQKALNTLRKLCLDDKFLLPDKEPEEQREYRILRTAARRNGGMLDDSDLAKMVLAHGTKKAVMEQLSKAGFELRPTLDRVKKMKASELKQL